MDPLICKIEILVYQSGEYLINMPLQHKHNNQDVFQDLAETLIGQGHTHQKDLMVEKCKKLHGRKQLP